MTARYHRTAPIECEELEDELVVMESESQAVVALNPMGRIVWELIADGASFDHIDAIFREAHPEVDSSVLRRDIQGVLDTLLDAGLILVDEG